MGATVRQARVLLTAEVPDTIHDDGPSWRTDAVCAEIGEDLFFVHKGESVSEAKRACLLCTVREPCLIATMHVERGIAHSARFGVYAGLTPKERQALWGTGWRPGDPLPDIRIGNDDPGECPHCGKPCKGVNMHIAHVHPELRRGAA